MEREVTIGRRFRGPPRSGNGGYSAGVVAEGIEGTAEVTLRSPPPLDTPLTLSANGAESRLTSGDELIAEAVAATLDLQVPEIPSLARAKDAGRRYAFREKHLLPGCFVCGIDRTAGDGLRIFAGQLEGSSVVAAPWVPDPSLGEPGDPLDRRFVWSALDCPSYFGLGFTPIAVVGRLTAAIDRPPVVGEQVIAVGWPIADDGRKHQSGSALATAEGEIIARAEAVWIEISSY